MNGERSNQREARGEENLKGSQLLVDWTADIPEDRKHSPHDVLQFGNVL
jgi:hypothetical protein